MHDHRLVTGAVGVQDCQYFLLSLAAVHYQGLLQFRCQTDEAGEGLALAGRGGEVAEEVEAGLADGYHAGRGGKLAMAARASSSASEASWGWMPTAAKRAG